MKTKALAKKGSFITNEEGRVIFIGGPSGGGGSSRPSSASRLIPDGYTWEQTVEAAEYIGHNAQVPEHVDNLLDQVRLREAGAETYGEWADKVLQIDHSSKLIDSADTILTPEDKNQIWGMADTLSALRRRVEIVSDESIHENIAYDSIQQEWGISPHALHPTRGYIMGTTQFDPNRWEYVIKINAEVPDKRRTFWHEMAHTVNSHLLERYIGPKRSGESVGDYHDRFADTMVEIGKKGLNMSFFDSWMSNI
jgi:energy-coupling factor transporter ATP-binding protein EcfA2